MKNINFVFIIFIVTFYSCSSGSSDKYDLLSKNDKQSIDSFCVCSEPLQPLFEKMQNLKDSSSAIMLLDSLTIMIKEYMTCIDYIKNLDNKEKDEERDKQVLAYIKEKHPKCLPLVLGEKKNVKDKD